MKINGSDHDVKFSLTSIHDLAIAAGNAALLGGAGIGMGGMLGGAAALFTKFSYSPAMSNPIAIGGAIVGGLALGAYGVLRGMRAAMTDSVVTAIKRITETNPSVMDREVPGYVLATIKDTVRSGANYKRLGLALTGDGDGVIAGSILDIGQDRKKAILTTHELVRKDEFDQGGFASGRTATVRDFIELEGGTGKHVLEALRPIMAEYQPGEPGVSTEAASVQGEGSSLSKGVANTPLSNLKANIQSLMAIDSRRGTADISENTDSLGAPKA